MTDEHENLNTDSGDPKNVVQIAKAVFEKESLSFPFVPAALVADLRPLSDFVFGTRKAPAGLYRLETFISELEQGDTKDYLLMGFDGHGISSRAMHYYLVFGPLALFLQLSWANPFADSETCRRRISGALFLAKSLFDELHGALEKGDIPPDRRMVVVESDFGRSRWGWSKPGTPFSPVDEPRALFCALREVRTKKDGS